MNDIQEVAEATSPLDQLRPLARSKRDFSPPQIDGPKAELRKDDGRMRIELSSGVQLVSAAASEAGPNEFNNDAVYQAVLGDPESPIGAVYVLADGIGKEEMIGEASKNAVRKIGETVQAIDFVSIPPQERATAIHQSIIEATIESVGEDDQTVDDDFDFITFELDEKDERVDPWEKIAAQIEAGREKEKERRQKISLQQTTVVVAVVVEDKLYTFGLGDPRIYLKFKNEEVLRATTDHTLAEELIQMGANPRQIYERGKALWRYSSYLKARFKPRHARQKASVLEWDLGQIVGFLLCSDGVWHVWPHNFNVLKNGDRVLRRETESNEPDGGWIGEAMTKDPVTAAQELTSPDVQEITGDNVSGIVVSVVKTSKS
jgi:serine/threonine protein phosphatase PrpC